MWLFYFDILVDKILKSMDRSHPDYDNTAEFPNLGYFIIYEVFHLYGEWLRAIECCPEDSPAVRIERTSPGHENGSIAKSTMLSIGHSLRHLIDSETDDRFVAYIIEVLMRDYRILRASERDEATGDYAKFDYRGGRFWQEGRIWPPTARCYDRLTMRCDMIRVILKRRS
jgi:hypothetical protein